MDEDRWQEMYDALVRRHAKLCVKVDTLYNAIAHGDEEHREWLRQKIEEHFHG